MKNTWVHLFMIGLFMTHGLWAYADLVITMGGDVNFNKTRLSPAEGEVQYPYGGKASFKNLLSGIKPFLNGDLNFANLETVVSDKALTHEQKGYTFVSHPSGVAQMIENGFNLFALANNHSWDAGFSGFEETHFWMEQYRKQNNIHFHGIASHRAEVLKPLVINMIGGNQEYVVAFAAISFTDPKFRSSDKQWGQLNLRHQKDLSDFIKAMAGTSAHLKIVSIHTGTEGQVTLDQNQKELFRSFIDQADVSLVIGHHPHVVRPVEIYKGALILYSLGNYMMPGSADISARKVGYDYGLLARAYLEWDETKRRMEVQAVEAIPLTKVHAQARLIKGVDGAARIDFLNQLSAEQLGQTALQFKTRTDGTGVACPRNTQIGKDHRAQVICRVR